MLINRINSYEFDKEISFKIFFAKVIFCLNIHANDHISKLSTLNHISKSFTSKVKMRCHFYF